MYCMVIISENCEILYCCQFIHQLKNIFKKTYFYHKVSCDNDNVLSISLSLSRDFYKSNKIKIQIEMKGIKLPTKDKGLTRMLTKTPFQNIQH